MIAASLLLAASLVGGDLWIHTGEGLEIFLDGKSVGRSVAVESGRLLHDIEPGIHHVVVRAEGGSENEFDVEVIEARSVTIEVSGLGVRARGPVGAPQRGGALTVTSKAPDCRIAFRQQITRMQDGELRIDDIPPGRYPLGAICGGARFETMVDVKSEKLLALEADAGRQVFRPVDERPRSFLAPVPDRFALLMRTTLPADWKRLIASMTPPQVKIDDVNRLSPMIVTLDVRAPDVDTVWKMLSDYAGRVEIDAVDALIGGSDGTEYKTRVYLLFSRIWATK